MDLNGDYIMSLHSAPVPDDGMLCCAALLHCGQPCLPAQRNVYIPVTQIFNKFTPFKGVCLTTTSHELLQIRETIV
jgi:hypothetical protein